MSEPPQVDSIFLAATELASDEERAAYLAEACGDDANLRSRVEQLLKAHAEAGSFMDESSSVATADDDPKWTPDRQIGPYKLLEQIGEGGMGVVYMAEQTEPVERRVAVKIIKPGMDTRQVIARFEAERQALAMMDHPNIATVLDAGATDSGRPYFVMELVKGVPITEYCDKRRLSLRKRLELFLPVCQAVQHAHQKGIIHRDLKPTNVLIAEYDERPVAKVIDFGVAKAVGQRLTEKTMFTEFGQLVGTFEYMSPEQAKLNQLDIDTRTDVYSLGVLLYELLTGQTPLDRNSLRDAAFDEMLRIIREVEPLRPSLRLSTSEALPSIAANRQLNPRELSKLVDGELDWIVMRALEKDRTRRYETASSLARDIERHLNDQPVQACPPSAAYRFRKFARRNKLALATSAFVMVCLALLLMGALVYAAQQRDLAIGRAKLATDRETARQEAEAAQIAAETELYRALLGRAAAVRTARAPGYRREVWRYLHQAAALDIPQKSLNEIRDEVLACLGDPIGLDPLDFPVAERMPTIVVPDQFRKIIDETQAREKRIATAAADGLVTAALSATGAAEKRLPTAVSADGQWLAIRDSSNTDITLWDVDVQVAAKASTPLGIVQKLAFSPDGKLLAAGCEEGTVVLSVPDLRMQTFFRGVPVYRSLAFHPSGHQLATLDFAFKIEVWSLRSNRHIAAMMSPGGLETIEYSADGTLLLGIAGDGKTVVKGWPMNATPEKRTLLGHNAIVPAVDFSPDGRLLASSSHDGTVRVWDAETGALLHDLTGHRERSSTSDRCVQAVKFSPESKLLGSASWDGSVIVWDPITGERLARAQEPTDLWDVAFDSSGRFLVAVGTARLVCWEIISATGNVSLKPVRTVPLNGRGVDVAFQPDSSKVAILIQNPTILLLCDVMEDDAPRQLNARPVVGWYTLHFDRSGERLFFQSTGSLLGEWDCSKERVTYRRTKVPGNFHAFTADTRWLAAPDEYPYQVRIFDLPSDRELFVLPQGSHNKTDSLAWSPDGARLAVGGNDGDLAMWELGEVAARLREFGDGIDPTSLEAIPLREAEALLGDAETEVALEPWPNWGKDADTQALTIAQRGDWAKSLQSFVLDARNHPNNYVTGTRLGSLQLYLGQSEAYRRTSQGLLDSFSETTDLIAVERIARVCALAPAAVNDFSEVEALMDRMRESGHLRFWDLLAMGLVEYRAGRPASAVQSLDRALAESLDEQGTPTDVAAHTIILVALSLAKHDLGDVDAARESLNAAQARIADLMPDFATLEYPQGQLWTEWLWYDWIHCLILAREAETELALDPWPDWGEDAPGPAIAPFDAEHAKKHQEAWANYLGVPVQFTNSLGMIFRLIPPGDFTMGSSESEIRIFKTQATNFGWPDWTIREFDFEGPKRKARVTKPFYLGTCEVTNAEFRRFVDATGYQTVAERTANGGWADYQGQWVRRPEHIWKTPGHFKAGDNLPVVQLSHLDAERFCRWLSDEHGLNYTLPNETQWEMAARAGTTRIYGASDDPESVLDVGWMNKNLPTERSRQPQPVGTKPANPFGLRDTLGNVWEMCTDSHLQLGSKKRVGRGGNWTGETVHLRPACRGAADYDIAWDCGLGFRVAITGDLSRVAMERAATPGNAESEESLPQGSGSSSAPTPSQKATTH